ncbi:low molecular weight phosphatase family protein [Polymorphum gilvum]|uniref:Protein-tyrosine phosphatase, low molecular weight n=1 Tax=Polymorphum gilvum (strain LMG 25793 / CGMCC 1.9160 / SL003B-26A1) TaxID=991905 RepID=F2IVD9_POLGS|nr:low molecular weight phosphatase family protein [Polymorphum gilvum]ADZ72657.1 Protein-tyrosine phosphatase, low molecular weight [Polymorphum gilvum SL003B-26A1]
MSISTVLFVCPDNALLGPLAEAYLNAVAGRRIRAFSAGPRPGSALHPHAVRLLDEHGLSTAGLAPKSWDVFLLPHAPQPDRIVALAAAVASDSQPCWRGDPARTLWDIADPQAMADVSGRPAELFRRIRLCIDRCLSATGRRPGAARLLRAG